MNSPKPSPVSTKPVRSNGARLASPLRTSSSAAASAIAPSGRLSRKIQCQLQCVLIQPPTGGPRIGATSAGQVRIAMARTICSFGVLRNTTSRPTGTIIAPPRPCSVRAAVKAGRLPLAAHSSEDSVNTMIAAANTRRAPKRSAIQPLIGMNTVSATR